MHNRQNALHQWLEQVLQTQEFNLHPLAGDASFRRYFRLHQANVTRVIMDAPPEKETIEPFIAVAQLFAEAGVRTPKIYFFDVEQGFAILDDFGDSLLLPLLTSEAALTFYPLAMQIIKRFQQIPLQSCALPLFDQAFISQELSLFKEWFLKGYLHLELTDEEEQLIDSTFAILCNELTAQPQVVIHRDFHSRNLLVLNQSELGVIDFQDAMQGPITYDLVSLLRDCYIQWPSAQIQNWIIYFYQQAQIQQYYSLDAFIRAFDYCGLQRHLKVLGVFSRLHLRDNKSNYLSDLPLTLHYVMASLESYEELRPFYTFMQHRIRLP